MTAPKQQAQPSDGYTQCCSTCACGIDVPDPCHGLCLLQTAVVCAAGRTVRLSSSVSKLEHDGAAEGQSQELLVVGAVTNSQASLKQVRSHA